LRAIQYRSLHAPKENGAALIEPPIGEFAEQVASYFRTAPDGTRLCWGAKSMLAHRVEARMEMRKWFDELPDMSQPPALNERRPKLVHAKVVNQPLVFVGHQPHLFHPGVWMKNFVAARLAELIGGKAVNLIVDNDLMKGASIAVPSRASEGAVGQVAFDAPGEEMPFEERSILDESLAKSFVARISDQMVTTEQAPLLFRRWIEIGRRLGPNDQAKWGYLFSELRRGIENDWCNEDRDFARSLTISPRIPTRRIPKLRDISLSFAISTRAFARLIIEIVHDAKNFAEVYNGCLAEYRQVHGLRSRSHPAPDLEIASTQEVELPFWLWTTGSPHRKRAFVRRTGTHFAITDREGIEWSATFDDGEELLDKMVAGLLSPTNDRTRPKLRPKGLITTLYARLLLCDGFVHGIGGAKYDQVTEAIAERWGLGTLAPMQCATMTLRLPLPMNIIPAEEVRQRKRKLRDLIYHPETFIEHVRLSSADQQRAAKLHQKKIEWIGRQAPSQLHERHYQIKAINAELAVMLSSLRTRFEQEYDAAHKQFAAQQPWLSREFAAVLFPEEMLKSEFARVVTQ
jgi:hypothetical protein